MSTGPKSTRRTRGTSAPRRRRKRGPAPDPERADLIPTLYRVKPQHHDALSREAEERAARRWEEEVEAAKREGRRPRPLVKRKDASEVLRELLDGWIAKRGK
jgi:hypothetical protein